MYALLEPDFLIENIRYPHIGVLVLFSTYWIIPCIFLTIILSYTGCPEGIEEFVCLTAPCTVNTCTAHPDATCRDNYCGGCNAEFYDANGNKVNCDGKLKLMAFERTKYSKAFVMKAIDMH